VAPALTKWLMDVGGRIARAQINNIAARVQNTKRKNVAAKRRKKTKDEKFTADVLSILS